MLHRWLTLDQWSSHLSLQTYSLLSPLTYTKFVAIHCHLCPWNKNSCQLDFQGYGPAVKAEEEVERVVTTDLNVDRHMNVNVTSSGQGTKTVILQIPKVCLPENLAFDPILTFFTFRTSNKEIVHQAEVVWKHVRFGFGNFVHHFIF